MKVKLDAQTMREFAQYMARKNRAKIVLKKNFWQMKIIARALSWMGIANRDKWLNNYSLTLGNKIYLSFPPGTARPSYINQIRVITHECEHPNERRRHRPLIRHDYRYVRSRAYRAGIEVKCLIAEMEIIHYLTGQLLKPSDLADSLRFYGLESKHIQSVKEQLEEAAKLVKRGAYQTKSAKNAIKFFEKRLK